jgi:hypothetical protein
MIGKLKSRKFLLAAGGFLSVLLSEIFGVSISWEAMAGGLGVIASYILGEGIVDAKAVQAAAAEARDSAYTGLVEYARGLEAQLAELYETMSEPELE